MLLFLDLVLEHEVVEDVGGRVLAVDGEGQGGRRQGLLQDCGRLLRLH